MIMASLLTLQRQQHDFSKRWNSLVQLSQGKLNLFERVYQLKNGSLLCEQKSQSEVVLMPHPHVSKVQHREVTRPGASGSMVPIPVFRMCWNSTFCSTGFLSLGICVCVCFERERIMSSPVQLPATEVLSLLGHLLLVGHLLCARYCI